ncbi:unnamed protein product, partial [Symbiodinium necroappetens]
MAAVQLEPAAHQMPGSLAEARTGTPRGDGQGSGAPARHDLPQIRTSAGGLLSRAIAAAKPANAQHALQDFRDNIYARSARAPLDARWTTWCKICSAWEQEPIPLTPELIEMVGASFRFGGYRSSAQYFSRARKEHIRVTGMPAPAAVELAIRDAIRSIERGMGANAAKDAFRLDVLDFDLTSKGASFSLAHGMVVLGSWFLCREIELANLRVKHMAVDTTAKQVTLALASSKTDTVGSLVHRKHSCYCGVVPENICPYHAALRIADECSVDPEDFLFSPTPGVPLSKHQTIELIHDVLQSAGINLSRPGAPDEPDVQGFGGHCLRVSGAQHLCRMRIPVSTIMLLGRWGSRAIERYVQETELEYLYPVAPSAPPMTPARSQAIMDTAKEPDLRQWTLVQPSAEMQEPPAQGAKKPRTASSAKEDTQISSLLGTLDGIAERLEAIQDRPDLVCKSKAHARDPEESSRPPVQWRAKCGWAYGYAKFTRAHDDGSKELCRKCFPESSAASTAKLEHAPARSEALFSSAGAAESLRKYITNIGVTTTAIFAELGETIEEFDEAVVAQLRKPVDLHDGTVLELAATEFPVARARLRHVWKKCREAHTTATPAATATTTTTSSSSSTKTKELPPGYWQQQIKKYEAVQIKGIARRFPATLLLGAEATLAKLIADAKNGQHCSVPLEEIVQHRHFKASGEPNNLASKKRSRTQEATTLVVNADLQLETEPEDRWHPQSQTALLDCLTANHMALIFIEYAPEHDLDRYFEYWQRLVRSKPNKIEQLKLHWENTSWRIALALRKATPFKEIADEIIVDSQALQDAMNRDIQPERPTKAPRQTEQPWLDRRGGRGRGHGKGKDWQPYRSYTKGGDKGNGRGRGKGRGQWQGQRYQRQYDEDKDYWRRNDDNRYRANDQKYWKSWQQGRRSLAVVNKDLESLGAEHFPQVTPRGDFEQEDAATIQKLVEELDPSGRARIVIAGGPPCHDFSRIRQDAPGHAGHEGSKFTRFAQLIQSVEKSWGCSRAILLVENVIPQNRADMRKVERMLDAPRWYMMLRILGRFPVPGIPRVHFDVDKDTLDSFDTEGLTLPRVPDRGKISSEATQRWLADKRRYAPWHYESGVMMMDRWSASLPDHARHKAIANGWHAGAARLMFIMAVFAATPPTPAAELNPLGGTPLDITAALWQGKSPLLGPGPGDYDEFDLSHLEDPDEHWRQSRVMPHPDARDAAIEPGLRQWLQVWSRMRPHLPELRDAVAQQIEDLVDDLQEETEAWYSRLAPHVQKAYRSETRTCSLQLPALEKVCNLFGWQDRDIFKELTHGFRLLGPLAPGLGWKTRNDLRYADPMPIDEFLQKNELYVRDKLRRCRVDPCWEAMAQEIAGDVTKGRMEGPFSSPASWPKQAVPLTTFSHTSKLAQGPTAHKPTCFAFAVHQVGSDGKPKVRRAEDWRRSFANATVGAKDSPTYHDISAYVQLAVAIKQKHPQAQLLIWGLDHEAAYRQLAAEDPDHTWVILPTPHGITLWRHTVLMFGSVASVWAYCRIADLMSWLCRACLLTPALHFVDDFGSCENADLEQPPHTTQVIQGVEISVHDSFVKVSGTAARRQRLDEDLVSILMSNRLPPNEASSLAGRLQFYCQSLLGKSHSAALRPLFRRAQLTGHGRDNQQWSLNKQLLHGIGILRWSLKHAAPRTLPFEPEPHSVVYADAFFNLFDKDWKPGDDDIPNWGRTPPETLRNGWGFVATIRGRTLYANGT